MPRFSLAVVRAARVASAAVSLAASTAVAALAQPVTPRWVAGGPGAEDYVFAVDSTVAHGGRASLRISAADEPAGFGGISTVLPAAPYVGRRLHIATFVRTRALHGQGAALWARADGEGANDRNLAFASSQGRQAIGGTTGWVPVAIDLDVPAGAAAVFVGAFASGAGTLWIDDLRIESVPPDAAPPVVAVFDDARDVLAAPRPVASTLAASPREAPRMLRGRAIDNLVAFTRLTGYVRFFHPGDAAATTNWDEFTVRGMRAVERAPTADSLVATLRALFADVAPSVALYRTGTRPPAVPPATGDAIVFWQHFGFGVPVGTSGASNVYRSTRVRIDAPAGRLPATVAPEGIRGADDLRLPVPDPSRPFLADLGGGVSASVPMALYTTASRLEDGRAHPGAATERFSVADRATRLADVALAWMVMQHFYPYHDVVHPDWDRALRTALATAATDSGAAAFDATLERLIAMLHDGHGNVARAGSARALPAVRLDWIEHRLVVSAVGDSVAGLGVHRGDEVVAIDGRPAELALREIETRISGATPQWIRTVALGRVLAGDIGTGVTLRLRDATAPGAPPRDVRLVRGGALLPTVARPEKIAELRPGVFYVDLDRVTDDDVRSALPTLARATGIVFDMRGYPRQVSTPTLLALLTDSVIHSAHFEVPFVTRPDHAGMLYGFDGRWTLRPAEPRLRAKIAFLTGGGAISYAESTMGVVEDNHLGAIVGSTTAGTNGNVDPFGLPGGYTVAWTGMRVRKGAGGPHHGVGIAPTVPVEPTLRGLREGRDEVLERGLAVVSPPTVP